MHLHMRLECDSDCLTGWRNVRRTGDGGADRAVAGFSLRQPSGEHGGAIDAATVFQSQGEIPSAPGCVT